MAAIMQCLCVAWDRGFAAVDQKLLRNPDFTETSLL